MTSKETLISELLAHDDTGGAGRLVLMLPGAGDVRSEYRFLVDRLAARGHRVVTADLPGHGSSPLMPEYTVRATSAATVALLESLAGGPAVIVGCSFAPAAAVWAAAERPDLVAGLVAISPHFHADESPKGRLLAWATKGLLRGPWAAGLWASMYAGWYGTNPPADLASQLDLLRSMLGDPARRKAVRETLTADRAGVADRMAAIGIPTLTVFGSRDDHFADPAAEAEATASRLGGDPLVVDGAGHYPHVESPEVVATAILGFLARLD